MLRPYTLTPSPQVVERHHANPPAQWIVFCLSSAIVHVLAFWLIPGLAMRQQNSRLSNEPVPVQLIDLSAIAPRPGLPQATSVQPPATVPQTPIPRVTPPVEQPPIQQLEKLPAPVVPAVVQPLPVKPTKSTVTRRRVIPSPQSSTKTTSERIVKRAAQPTTKPRVSPTTPLKRRSPSSSSSKPASTTNSSQPSPNTKPAPQAGSQTNSESSTSPETSATPPQTTTAQKPVSPPQETSTKPLPDTSSTTRNPAIPASEPSSTSQGSESQRGGSLVATLSNPRLANGGTDVPDKLATPQQQERRFSGLTYPAKVGMNFDQAIVLQVLLLIDNKGQATVQATKTLQGGAGVDAEFVAREMIKDWKFEPATQAGQAVDSLLEVTLTVNPGGA